RTLAPGGSLVSLIVTERTSGAAPPPLAEPGAVEVPAAPDALVRAPGVLGVVCPSAPAVGSVLGAGVIAVLLPECSAVMWNAAMPKTPPSAAASRMPTAI
ncbi:hypothetical protein HWN77_26650, partial [Escherichia coli]|uniref:hypothetical protein n=1 Tax=Escherichia coli TaxID=562 RepID=UPI00159BA21D